MNTIGVESSGWKGHEESIRLVIDKIVYWSLSGRADCLPVLCSKATEGRRLTMCYINEIQPGNQFMTRDKTGIWMRTEKEFNWILDERGLKGYDRMSDLDSYRDHGFLCVDVDTGDLFVFTAGTNAQLDVCPV